MAKIIKDMQLDEISLVDDPANPEANVVIAKAKNGGGFKPCADCGDEAACRKAGKCLDMEKGCGPSKKVAKALAAISAITKAANGSESADDDAVSAFLKEHDMTLEELEKALTDAKSALDAADAVIKSKDAEITTLKAALADAQDEVKKSKEAQADPTEEELMKSLPESLRKRFVAMEAASKAQADEIEKMRTEREEAEAIEKARGLAGDPKVVGPALLRIRKGKATDADLAEIERLLKAANNQSKTSELYKARGATGDEPADPETLLKAKADEIRKGNKDLSSEQAYAKALEENPELYNAYIEKRRTPAA